MERKSLPQTYLNDIALHSDITKNERIAPKFEQSIAKQIQIFIIELYNINTDLEIIYSDIVTNTYFDYVLAVQNHTNDTVTFYYLKNADKYNIDVCTLSLIDTNDKFKQYFNLNIESLPKELKHIIKTHNRKTTKDIITAHRVIASLKYNISGLDIHHCTLSRYNPDGVLKRLKQPLNIKELLPCTWDFHLNVLHAYINDCISTQDEQTLTECSFECIEALEKFVNKTDLSSKKDYKEKPEIIASILKDYLSGITIKNISAIYNISKPTVAKIIDEYSILTDWI